MKRRAGLEYIWIVLVGTLSLMTLVNPVRADETEHWTALSNTAISITGDMVFTPTSITFQNNAVLSLSYLGTGPGVTWAPDAKDRPARIFKITKGGNPAMLGGNTLCGPIPPTYLTVLETVDATAGTTIYLTAFTGSSIPTRADYESRLCAGFTYMPASKP